MGVLVRCLFIVFLSVPIVSSQEEQILPIDSAGTRFLITKKLAAGITALRNFQNVESAQIVRSVSGADRLEVVLRLEVVIMEKGMLFRYAMPLTEEGLRAIRREVAELLITKEKVDQSGRTKVIVTSSLMSAGYYSWALPLGLNIQSAKAGVSIGLLTAGSGFFASYNLTKNTRVTDGAGTLFDYGMTRGVFQGYMIYGLINGSDYNYRNAFLSSIGGSVAGGIVGFNVASRLELTGGQAEMISAASYYGGFIGALGSIALNQQGEFRPFASMELAGASAGAWVGYRMGLREHYTRGDAYVVRATTHLGAFLPLTLLDQIKTHDDRVYATGSLLGTGAGFTLGHFLVQDRDFTTSQGVILNLAEGAGALAGAGIAYLARKKSSVAKEDRRRFGLLAGLGATTAFALVYKGMSSVAAEEAKSDFSFGLFPQNILMAHSLKRVPLPVLEMGIRF